MLARAATVEDAPAIARIYNEGIADGVATFETRTRTADDVRSWFDGVHPAVVVEFQGEIIAYGVSFAYRPRDCYRGIAEASLYVARAARGHGAGRLAMNALLDALEREGFWKVVSRIFVENDASRGLCRKTGFREVGIYEKHGQLNGVWRDVVIVERLLPANLK
jgi:L-amino acid N-acyltransferase YncA